METKQKDKEKKISRPRWSADALLLERIEQYTKPRNMSLSAFLRAASVAYLNQVTKK